MEGSRLFRIESKMFEVAMSGADSRFRLHTYERGRYFLRSVFLLLGRHGAGWLQDSLALPDLRNCEKDFLKTFREGETAFILQLMANAKGQQLMLTEFDKGSKKG